MKHIKKPPPGVHLSLVEWGKNKKPRSIRMQVLEAINRKIALLEAAATQLRELEALLLDNGRARRARPLNRRTRRKLARAARGAEGPSQEIAQERTIS